jgi:cystathionine beta-lyase/cystathionine gamma-synthase
MSSKRSSDRRGRSTISVHGGELGKDCHGAVTTPIFQTSTFYFPTDDPITWEGKVPDGSFIYSRHGNPTISAVEGKMASLENAEAAVVFSSGMAAISTTILSLVKNGDRLVTIEDLYGGTFNLMRSELLRFGVDVRMVSTTDTKAMERELEAGASLVYLESPTNPLLKLVDIKTTVDLAHSVGAKVMIDSTFATPINQNPIDMGVDVVVHSATKYLNGHSDLIAGAVVGGKEDMKLVYDKRIVYGGSLDPMGAFLLMRGMKTLDVRMQRHNANGMAVAKFLERHEKIERVHYPGLPSHPQHELAERQMRGFGGMVSFEVVGGRAGAEKLLRSLRIIKRATSLGGVDSLVSMPLNSSHSLLTPEERSRLGIRDSLVRLSVGIEDAEDIIDDLNLGLSQI